MTIRSQTIQGQDRARGETGGPVAVERVRSSVQALVGDGHGPIAVCDALVTVAAELMLDKVGRAGAALWLRDVFDDVRFRRA